METIVYKNKLGKLGENYGRKVVFGLAVLAIIIGFILVPDIEMIGEGLKNLFFHHLRSDSEPVTIAGNTGSVWVNAGIIMFLMWLTYKVFDTKVGGIELAAVGQTFGVAFYGLSLFNIIPPVIGALIEAKISGKDIRQHTGTAWFATGLSPFVSVFAFHIEPLNPGSPLAISFALLLGLLLGYLTSMFAGYVKTLHKGRLLFNMGFTTGIVAWLVYNVLKALGFEQNAVEGTVFVEGRNLEVYVLFGIVCLYFIAAGALYNGGFKDYFRRLFWNQTDNMDYTQTFGIGNAVINMGVIGILVFIYIALVPNAEVTGGILAAVFTAVGFAANGITIRGALPLLVSVYVGSLFFGSIQALIFGESVIEGALTKVSSMGMIVAAIQSMGSSPVTERDGWKTAVVIGLLHQVNVVNTGTLHGWMSSYNNGFSQGLVMTLFYPVWHFFSKRNKQLEKSE